MTQAAHFSHDSTAHPASGPGARRSHRGAIKRRLTGLGLAALGALAACTPNSTAEQTTRGASGVGAYDQCAKVLEGDLFDRIEQHQASAQVARAIIWETLLSMSEDQAYDKYLTHYDEAHQAGGGGGLDILGIFSAKGNGGDNRKLTREEFKERYRLAKAMNSSASSSDQSDNWSLTSGYASYIRDANTIQAWRDCVTAQPQPGLYAYGSRDDAGNVYVQVVWAPGDFAGVAPGIHVKFVQHRGFTVDAPDDDVLAVGSGASYAVTSGNLARGFEVRVNGMIYDKTGTEILSSISTVAKIPPVKLPPILVPDDCEVQRFEAFEGGAASKQLLETMRRFGEVPIYRVNGVPLSGIAATVDCEQWSP